MTRTRHPALDLLARYRAALSTAWTHRTELAGPTRLADEAAFLPAALSLQDTPVHPAPRRFAYALMALFTITLAWACLGKVDIVAIAPGRIVVSERTKLIQPLERSVVKAVLVKDGDHVNAGQALVELDPTIANADKTTAQDQLQAVTSDIWRATVLLQMLQKEKLLKPTPLGLEVNLPLEITQNGSKADGLAAQAQAQAQLQAEWSDITARLTKFASEISRRQAEIATASETVAKLEATVPLAQTRETDFKTLVQQGYISGHATQDKTRERIELERDLQVQRARLAEAKAALMESQSAQAAYIAETRRALSERQAQGQLKRQQATQEQTKATQREKLTTLTAPVSGTVQQLAIHSVGGVVTDAQALMVIVPDMGKEEASVTAEVTMENKDIGYIAEGQSAQIKLETFPYTQYGTIAATVKRVTADAVTDEKRGAIFPATLALNATRINIDGKWIRLQPGMNVTAEIKTGQRRVIEYLLSPVQRVGSESLRER